MSKNILQYIFYPKLPMELVNELSHYKSWLDQHDWTIYLFHKIELLPRITRNDCVLDFSSNVTICDDALKKYSNVNKFRNDIQNLENTFHSILQCKVKSVVNLATEDLHNVPDDVMVAYKILLRMKDDYYMLIEVDYIPGPIGIFKPQILIDLSYPDDFIL